MNWRKIKNKKTAPNQVNRPITLFAGFWSRVQASVTDIFMIGMPVAIITSMFIGYDATRDASFMNVLEGHEPAVAPDPTPMLVNMGIFFLIYLWFWFYKKGQTPGKRMARIAIVDASTLKQANILQLILRFLGYALSIISVLGLLLPLILPKKQALHDLLSNTAVIYVNDDF